MILKYKDQPIWLQILVPSLLIITAVNTAGLIYLNFYLKDFFENTENALQIFLVIRTVITGSLLLTFLILTGISIQVTKRLSKYVKQKFRNVSLLEPADKNETRLITGILDEYARVFNEKNGDLKEARQKADLLTRFTDEMPLPVIKMNPDGIYSYMNNAAWSAELEKLFDRNERLLAPWRTTLREMSVEGRSVEWNVKETVFLVQPVKINGEKEFFLCLKDVSSSGKLLDKLNNYDLLTNLPNRVLFMEVLAKSVKYAERTGENCVIILLDIDDLERINDTFGYPEGDRLLSHFGRRLGKTIRDEDTAARLSGDEFVILIPRLSKERLSLDFLQRIQNDLTKPFKIGEEEIFISISMGISIFPEDGGEPEDLLKKANTALSRSKRLRRGTFTIFDPVHDNQTLIRREMEQKLERAAANGEFELYYQPKVEISTETITGFEALIRWNREEPISPAEFIPLAEETGKIVDIGKFVIEEASRFLNILSERGRDDLQVAINISARQFKDPGFESYLLNTATSHRLDFSRLELEVTEGVAATETSEALSGLASLSAKGFSIAIDDFGTGYSSMNYLQDLSFDTLKIDKSFIDRIASDSGLPIVKAIIALGKSIRKKIVAEGVETREQLDILKNEGCDQIQGYYYSKPVPADEAIKLMENWTESLKKKL